MRVLVGTSGWQYASWRDRFYPPALPQRRWLEHYVEQFSTLEVNSTFYNLPTEATVQRWADATPAGFRFVVKASRYLTHIRRLREPQDPVDLLLERIRPLGKRLASVLVQLPPGLRVDVAALDRTLAAFGKRARVTVEFRDPSWFSDEVRSVLRRHGAALCVADRRGEHAEPLWPTARFAYLRFHEGDGEPYPCYRNATLRDWAERIAGLRCSTVYAFFNNDTRCCAPHDAAVLAGHCERLGLRVGRAPQPRTVVPG